MLHNAAAILAAAQAQALRDILPARVVVPERPIQQSAAQIMEYTPIAQIERESVRWRGSALQWRSTGGRRHCLCLYPSPSLHRRPLRNGDRDAVVPYPINGHLWGNATLQA